MGEVSVNEALEELRERLERWNEICAQLRGLYYRYLDLAAFRSEKCYFPGRKCRRSWGRKYDVGDLTLMWTYIANTAPLCGKLIRALAEVEHEIRKRALETLEKQGGIEKRKSSNGSYIVHIRLKRPIYGYLVLLKDKLYVIWGEFDGLSRDGKKRATEVEYRVLDIVERYKRGKRVEMEVEEYEIDREYERLWFEVPLPKSVSKLFGEKDKAPVVLFRNLGWLLSDDVRSEVAHTAGNRGQVAARLFDWIAFAKYVINTLRVKSDRPLIFKLSINKISKTKDGNNPLIGMRPIGTASEIIHMAYKQFGVALNKPEEVLAHGYTILKVLKENAFRREGNRYVIDNVGAWIALSNAVATLVIGDGFVMPFRLGIAVKSMSKALSGETTIGPRKLANALGGTVAGEEVQLQNWHMRLLLPISPMPTFEKSVKLYRALLSYPAIAIVEINKIKYLLTHDGGGKFVIGKKKGSTLYRTIEQLGLEMRLKGDVFVLTYVQLKSLVKYNITVRFLNDLEKETIRNVKPVSVPDLTTVKNMLENIVKRATIIVGLRRGRTYIRIIPHDRSQLEKITAMLRTAGIRFSILRKKRVIYVYEQKSVEMIREALPYIFSTSQVFVHT